MSPEASAGERGKERKEKVPFSRQSFNKAANTLQGPMPSSSLCLYLSREPQGILFAARRWCVGGWGGAGLGSLHKNCRGSDQIRHLSGLI